MLLRWEAGFAGRMEPDTAPKWTSGWLAAPTPTSPKKVALATQWFNQKEESKSLRSIRDALLVPGTCRPWALWAKVPLPKVRILVHKSKQSAWSTPVIAGAVWLLIRGRHDLQSNHLTYSMHRKERSYEPTGFYQAWLAHFGQIYLHYK